MATVDEAIKKGRNHLVHIPLAILIICVLTGCGFGMASHVVACVTFIVLGPVLGWLYWSIAATRWRIWAFGNVRNRHELRRKAIRLKLIWPSGSFFERTEIRNDAQKKELGQLEHLFNQPDVYEDDLSVPKETHVCYKKAGVFSELLLWFAIAGLGIWLLADGQWTGVLPMAIGGYLSYKALRRNGDSSPQLILNEAGIRFKETSLISWNDLDWGIEVSNNNNRGFLWISDGKTYDQIDLNEMDMHANEIERRIYIYEMRSERNRS